MTAHEVLLAWAKSEGFAAIHNGEATDEQIVDDLMAWLAARNVALVLASPQMWRGQSGDVVYCEPNVDPNVERWLGGPWVRA